MTHQDSMGDKTVIKAGDVQRMSAGTGLTHSEFNLARDPVHFHQIWILPDQKGPTPSDDQKHFAASCWHNTLFPVASGQKLNGAVTFHTAAAIYRCALDQGREVTHRAAVGRRISVYVTQGALDINGTTVSEKDQARIDTDDPLVLRASNPAEFMLIDVPSCKGWGYSAKTLKGQKA
jgi:hypothetical protein